MVRVCVIGAGPSGMSFIRDVKKLQREDSSVSIDLVCYEKQSHWGGQWNFSWRIGVDEFGEIEPTTMYRGLWTNNPKEWFEFSDYLMVDHFKKNLPSFLPREAILSYINAYWKKNELDKFDMRYNHVVKSVRYDSETDKFEVVARDSRNDKTLTKEIFDYVVNCSGHFSTPSVPTIEGLETFPNIVIHTAQLKSYDIISNKKILVIGAGFSGDDCAINSVKYGAEFVIVSYRSRPVHGKLPPQITQRPEVKCVNGSEVTFIDGSTAQVDMIVLATGYLHSYPYMSDDLRLTGPNKFFPKGLHHGALWKTGGNNKVFYIGAPNLAFAIRGIIAQSRWCVMYIAGKIQLRSPEEMEAYDQNIYQREASSQSLQDIISMVVDWLTQLSEDGQLGVSMDLNDIGEKYFGSRSTLGLERYKNVRYKCLFSGVLAAELFKPYMEIKDCSLEELLSHY